MLIIAILGYGGVAIIGWRFGATIGLKIAAGYCTTLPLLLAFEGYSKAVIAISILLPAFLYLVAKRRDADAKVEREAWREAMRAVSFRNGG